MKNMVLLEKKAVDTGVYNRFRVIGLVVCYPGHCFRQFHFKRFVEGVLIVADLVIPLVESGSHLVLQLLVCLRCLSISTIENGLNLVSSIVSNASSTNIEPPIHIHIEFDSPFIELVHFLCC